MSKAFLPVAVYSVWQKGPTRKRVDINRVRYMKCLASRQLYEGEIVLILQLKELDAAQRGEPVFELMIFGTLPLHPSRKLPGNSDCKPDVHELPLDSPPHRMSQSHF